ncbi:hypothetical protein AK812_SmicGene20462 [Symbiodinium microadriaticum]|uniref:TLC domain-containing protein n=1 Tax=Symbiodinium microadriaticum TaxID=2951 RepID=A0A1Q9DPW0_SYMMI|nr:hypothetical protein AK812_SmicGene20462 [Symbiodinium microadriaticum]CAE7172571.1 unnamed protein product [Symbiodinium microadriaticum]
MIRVSQIMPFRDKVDLGGWKTQEENSVGEDVEPTKTCTTIALAFRALRALHASQLPGLERVHRHPSPGAGAMLLPLLLFAIWPGTEGAALRRIFRNEAQSSEPAQGEVVAHLYSVVDDYLRYYSEETATYKESKKTMTAIIRDALTEEGPLELNALKHMRVWKPPMGLCHDVEHGQRGTRFYTLVQAAAGGAVAALLFATVRSFKDVDSAEDIVDLCHSLYTCCVSASAASGASKQRRKRCDDEESEVLVLSPRAYASVTAMFARSLGYFWADALYIFGCRLWGHRPHMWRERLGHHALQTLANWSCLVKGPGLEARRCTLAFAYMAEASSVPLRLLALARRAKAEGVIKVLRACTLCVFGLSRILNGAFCMSLLVASRRHVSDKMLMLQLSGAAAAYAMNWAWFLRLIRTKFVVAADLGELSRLGSINEKARLKKQHDKTVAEYVAVMKQLDEALQAMEGKDWAEKHGVKDKLDAMYKEAPLALLSKASKPGHPIGLKQGLNLAADAAAHLRKLRSTLP